MANNFRNDGMESLIGHKRFMLSAQPGRAYFNNGVGLKGAYARGGLYGRVVDIPADMAVSRGVELEGDDDSVNLAMGELERLDVMAKLADCARWSQLDGCAALLVLTDDSAGLKNPMPDKFGKVVDIRVIEYDDIDVASANGYYDDPADAKYGAVKTYAIRILGGRNYWRTFVHESRIIPIAGKPLPSELRQSEKLPWAGRSCMPRVYGAIDKLELIMELGRATMERKQQAVHTMAGLADMLGEDETGEGERLVRRRIDLIDQFRSLTNSVAIDGEDGFSVYDLTLNGIPDMINQFRVAVSAESGLSQALLFERTKGGIGDSGNSDLESDYDIAEALQRKQIGPALIRLLSILARQDGKAGIDVNVKVVWPSLWTPTDQQQAETRLKNAQADKVKVDTVATAIDTEMLMQEEGRNWLASESMLGATPVKVPSEPKDDGGDDDDDAQDK